MSTLLTKLAADFTTQLAAAISIGGTTGTLLSQTDDDGNTLPDGVYVFTLDGSSSNKEYIRCTKTGTALTSIQSLSRQGALTSGVVRAHRIGASVSITDWAQLKYLTDLLSGATDLDSTDPLAYDGAATLTPGSNQLATVAYADALSIAGAAKATNSTFGIVKLSVAAVDPNIPIALGENDGRVLTQGENDAAAGTSGTPSGSNKFVTDADTSAAGVANKVIRADANGNLPVEIGVKFSLTGDFLAGDSLTANEAVVVSPYAQSDGGIKRDNEVASASSSYGITIGNNSNRILIVITADNSGGTISAVSAGGNAMTNINSYAGSGGYIKTWFLANPPTGSVTITITGAALMGSSARSFYNASQSAPTQFSNGNTTSAPPLNLGTLTATNQCSAILVFGVSANMSSSSFTGSVDASTQNNVFTNNGSQYTGSAWGGVKFANTVSTPTVNFASGSGTWAVSGVAMVIAPATAPALGLIKATASNTGINGALTEVVGFVYATKAVGSTDVKLYLPNGEVPGFSSLTAGSVYYLSNTAGAIATSAGTTSKKVGVASATTKLIPLIS